MEYITIDLENYERKDHFLYFSGLENPFVGLTAEVDVGCLVMACRAKKQSFYLAFMHAAALAADSVPEFRRRIVGGEIREYAQCPTSHTEALDNGTYCYCTLHHHMPLPDYFRTAEAERAAAKENGKLEEDEDVDGMYFITSVPWLHYSALVQPSGRETNPKISWGKYEEDFRGRLMMPVTVLLHHGLADGLHIAEFYEALALQIRVISEELPDSAGFRDRTVSGPNVR